MATASIISVQIESNETAATVAARLAEPSGNNHVGIRKLASFLDKIASGFKRGKVSCSIDSATNVTKATGTITMTDVATADQTFQIGGVTFTWKADGSGNESHVTIGAGEEASIDNLAAKVNAHSALVDLVTAESDGAGVLTLTAATPGRWGNLIATVNGNSSNLTMDQVALTGATTAQQEALVSWAVGTV